jgi:hypothetical protein
LGPKEGAALAFILALLASPSGAQELALPSGLFATLYDVVLEAGTGALAPDAFSDPEQIEDGDIPEDIALDVAPEGLAASAGDAGSGGLARFRLRVEAWAGVLRL